MQKNDYDYKKNRISKEIKYPELKKNTLMTRKNEFPLKYLDSTNSRNLAAPIGAQFGMTSIIITPF